MTKVEGKVRAGIIGTGSIAEISHFPSIQNLPQVDLVAVADVVEEKVKAAAKKWGAEAWYTDYQDMLKRGAELQEKAIALEKEILAIVEAKL